MPTCDSIPTEEKVLPYVVDGYTQDTYMYGYHSSYHSNSRNRAFNTPLVTDDRPESRFLMGSEIELAFKSDAKRTEFCANKSNWYCCENDGSLSGNAPMELITIPLHPGDATNPDFWKPLCKKLSSMGARSWTNNSTGHHVHISRSLFCNPSASISEQYRQIRTSISKVVALYALLIEDNPKAHRVFGRTECYQQVKLKEKTIAKLVKAVPNIMTQHPEVYQVFMDTVREANTRRTCEVNTQNKYTIEFRMGKGSICAERIAAINEFVMLFSMWAVSVRIGTNSTLEDFENYMKEKVRDNSWLLHFYFDLPAPDGSRETAPNPRNKDVCRDDSDM